MIVFPTYLYFAVLWQEALHREQMLEQKLATLQRLLANTQEASESSWQVGNTLASSGAVEALHTVPFKQFREHGKLQHPIL